jgi:hypothetical protein
MPSGCGGERVRDRGWRNNRCVRIPARFGTTGALCAHPLDQCLLVRGGDALAPAQGLNSRIVRQVDTLGIVAEDLARHGLARREQPGGAAKQRDIGVQTVDDLALRARNL